MSCQSCLAEVFLKLLHGTFGSKLALRSYFWALAWKRRAKAAFRGYFLSFCLELSGKSWLEKPFVKVECRSGFQECCAVLSSNGRGLGRSLSYVGRSQISLSMMLRGSVVHKLPFAAASEAFAWNHRAKVAFQSYPAGLAWNCLTKAALWSYFLSFRMELSCKSCFTSFCMQLSCKSCLAKLLLKLLHGTVMQKLPCKAIS